MYIYKRVKTESVCYAKSGTFRRRHSMRHVPPAVYMCNANWTCHIPMSHGAMCCSVVQFCEYCELLCVGMCCSVLECVACCVDMTHSYV